MTPDQAEKIRKITMAFNNQLNFLTKLGLQGRHVIKVQIDCGCGGGINVCQTTTELSAPVKLDKV